MLAGLLGLFADQDIEEILVNGTRTVQVIRTNASSFELPSPTNSDVTLIEAIQNFAHSNGMRLDPRHPSTGGNLLASQIRWHAMIPPASRSGAILSLRRHRLDSIDITNFAGISPHIKTILEWGRSGPGPILISGPTGSGKTSLLCSILTKIARNERLCILEDVPEIPALSPLWITGGATEDDYDGHGFYSIDQAFADCLRLRPHRFVVGEIRNREIGAFLGACQAGHAPTICTLHAGTPIGAISRLRGFAKNAGYQLSTILSDIPVLVIQLIRTNSNAPMIGAVAIIDSAAL